LKYFKVIITIIIVIGVLNSCTDGTPKCGDNQSKNLVIKIAKDELIKKGMSKLIPNINFEVINIRTTSHDKDVDSYQCASDFKMTGEKTKILSITYTVESTDDGEGLYVTVYGF